LSDPTSSTCVLANSNLPRTVTLTISTIVTITTVCKLHLIDPH
jgi:hypothetical protein